jgi:hypothetical protein
VTWLWSKVGGWLAAAGALLLLVFGAWQKGRREGKAVLQAEQEKARAQARQARKEIDDEVDGLGHADLDERFNRWVRGPEQR